MGKINNVHDKFIRAILSDRAIAEDYFKTFLPKSVSSLLNFSSLTQLPDTYLSKELQKTMSDIVYTCRGKDNGIETKVCLLIEHKSYPDRNTPVQIGGYIFSALQKQIDNKEELTPIIPILLYHGKGTWGYQTLSDLFKNLLPEWKHFIPDFDYVYNNLGEISDESVEALNNKFLAASLLTLKHSFQKDWLERNAVRILILSEGVNSNLQECLIVYLVDRGELKEEEIENSLNLVSSSLKQTVMNAFEVREKRGKIEGIEIGSQKTRLDVVRNLTKLAVLSDDQIALATDVTVDFVRNVRAELNLNDSNI